MAIEKYSKWKDETGRSFIPVSIDGLDLLHDQILNKGTAFTVRERREFHLDGLLPPHITTLPAQIERVYEGFCRQGSNIDKYGFLRSLQDRKETLYYATISKYLEEMLPIIYTPTVGEACQQFSHRFQVARGLYITPNNVDEMPEMIHHFPSRDISIIVATDSQGILGIGDQGVGGMGIPIGKLSLYVLGAGIHPASCLPITLDVGTNNEQRLNDPMYLGVKEHRIVGKEYRDFILRFVENIRKCFPNAVLQWEDFSKDNAFGNLERFRSELPSFNDDIQGTGAVTLAGIISALRIKEAS
jgi:malic enzyme